MRLTELMLPFAVFLTSREAIAGVTMIAISAVRSAAYLSLLVALSVHATVDQPGTLDPFFATASPLGAGKLVTPPIATGPDVANAMAVQADGKIVLAGRCHNGAGYDFCAYRYNDNGTLDTSFGSTGKLLTIIGAVADTDVANAVAIQPDGKIVLAGQCAASGATDFCAIRHNANGTLDVGFGTSGVVITAVGTSYDYVNGLALQPDGKLVLAGACYVGATNIDFCAVRYNANGTLDSSFGTGGKITTAIGTGDDIATAIAVQPDGKLVLSGSCFGAVSMDFCAARYNTNGTLDTTFNGSGKVITAFSADTDEARGLVVQPDGKLVLAGSCTTSASAYFCALRYRTNGTLDTSFGGTGKVVTAISAPGGDDIGNALVLQPDGKLIQAGRCDGSGGDFCALRYHPNGVLDTSFGTGGKVITAVSGASGSDNAKALVLQADGKLLLAGYCPGTGGDNFCALRYDGGPFGYQNCKPDLDGDGHNTATVDGLIYMRVMLGITGTAVVNGITFPAGATRNTWSLIRDHLVTQCGMSLMQ